MEGVERYKVRLLAHNEEWEREFARVRALIEQVWGEAVLAIEHVGSTAVPSIPAKPILDAAVMVRSLEALDTDALSGKGYDFCGYQGDSKERMLFVLRGEGQVSLQHIHVYQRDSAEFYRQTGFRDYLIAHPEAAEEYAAIKRGLAERFRDDRAAYTKGKEEFIRRILRRMEGARKADEGGDL